MTPSGVPVPEGPSPSGTTSLPGGVSGGVSNADLVKELREVSLKYVRRDCKRQGRHLTNMLQKFIFYALNISVVVVSLLAIGGACMYCIFNIIWDQIMLKYYFCSPSTSQEHNVYQHESRKSYFCMLNDTHDNQRFEQLGYYDGSA